MQPFTYNALPSRVIFGHGTRAQIGAEVAALGGVRALVITTPEQAGSGQALVAELGGLAAGLFAGATMHTPVEVTARALEYAHLVKADCLVAIGGGSTIGLAKAIALRTDLPQIAVPTTYAGSEATPILGQTQDGVKATQTGAAILPEVIVYDVDLTLSLPASLSVTSGLNAMAHAVEGLYSQTANPVISLIAEDGIRAFADALPRIVADPADTAGRAGALYGAWACGVTLGAVGMALHHKLCHTLGGTFDLPHSQTHAVILPHAMAYNARAAAPAMARVARLLGVENAALGMWQFGQRLGAPMTLAELGMPEAGIDRAVELALANAYWNPEPLVADGLRRLLTNAFHGHPPQE